MRKRRKVILVAFTGGSNRIALCTALVGRPGDLVLCLLVSFRTRFRTRVPGTVCFHLGKQNRSDHLDRENVEKIA